VYQSAAWRTRKRSQQVRELAPAPTAVVLPRKCLVVLTNVVWRWCAAVGEAVTFRSISVGPPSPVNAHATRPPASVAHPPSLSLGATGPVADPPPRKTNPAPTNTSSSSKSSNKPANSSSGASAATPLLAAPTPTAPTPAPASGAVSVALAIVPPGGGGGGGSARNSRSGVGLIATAGSGGDGANGTPNSQNRSRLTAEVDAALRGQLGASLLSSDSAAAGTASTKLTSMDLMELAELSGRGGGGADGGNAKPATKESSGDGASAPSGDVAMGRTAADAIAALVSDESEEPQPPPCAERCASYKFCFSYKYVLRRCVDRESATHFACVCMRRLTMRDVLGVMLFGIGIRHAPSLSPPVCPPLVVCQ
jgi:hypothetical protein